MSSTQPTPSSEPKALKMFDEARKILDEVDSTVDSLTMNGAVLPQPFGLILKVADAVRHIVDTIDDYEDAKYGVQKPAASAASSAPFDPTKSQPAG